MRVVFLAWRDVKHPQAGGSEAVIDQLASRLTDRGHDVVLLHGGPSTAHNYRSRSVGGTYSQYFRLPFEHRHRVDRADVVVDVSNGVPFWSPLWQRAPVVTLIHHVHTDQWAMQFPRPIAAVGRWLESAVATRVYRRARYVSVSSSTTSALINMGVAPDRIDTIEMGVSFQPAPRTPSAEPRFIIIGRLAAHKRVEVALRCWNDVRRELGGGELVVIGDGPELPKLQSLAGPGVRLTGRVDEATKRRELASAWSLIHPAHHEGWGVVITEAAMAEVPALGFDVAGVRDSIVDRSTGLLAGNEAEFVDKWITLGCDTPLRESLGRAACARAATFTWDRTLDRLEALLLDVADRQR